MLLLASGFGDWKFGSTHLKAEEKLESTTGNVTQQWHDHILRWLIVSWWLFNQDCDNE